MHTHDTVFQLCWLRETAAGHLETDLGTAVPSPHLELALMGFLPKPGEDNAVPDGQSADLDTVSRALAAPELVQALPKWLIWRMQSFFGPLHNEEKVEAASRQLEILRAMCERIRHAAGQRPWIELHLPYFNRRDWNKRFELFDAMRFTLSSQGWLQSDTGSDPLSLRETAMRIAAGVFHPRTDEEIPMRFRYDAATLQQPWAAALASRWGIRNLPEDTEVASVTYRVQGNPAEVWRKAPRLHHGRHHQTWARVALQVQWILRRWAMALQFSNAEGRADVESSLQTMMFQALRPWAENERSELSYDVLNEFFMAQQFKRAANRLRIGIEELHAHLIRSGEPELAKAYRGQNPSVQSARVADRAFRGKTVRTMLVAEAAIVNALMRFSQDVREGQAPKDLREAVEMLGKSFDEYLPRVLRTKAGLPPYMATAIFMEATAAMQAAIGAAPTVTVQLETTQGQVFTNRGPMMQWEEDATNLAA
ncbi:hypothetical protein F183_A39680 [Bryobacterales bacterium F-183]|nr:hypothetical protein F183_A39680 [Bryobacterales bacterium F-183]